MEKLTSDKILELLKSKISEMEFGYGDYDDEKMTRIPDQNLYQARIR